MHVLRRICVFCGSSPGLRPEYRRAARHLGDTLAAHGIDLVYGGSSLGLMGEVADATQRGGGHVIGVIPRHLVEREIPMLEIADLRVVESMHERKTMMYDLADGFIALPGGFGTMEEFFEVITWSQLGLHVKPAGLLDVSGYFGSLVSFMDHAVQEGFLRMQFRQLVLFDDDPARLLRLMREFEPPDVPQWLDENAR